ncbi:MULTISPECIES: collagen binding domain-containing protein [unclassified Corynebacterium]|uniref:MSCRAMM family protein n=1 Tax=unclassified Corynebacterium TaxID=2624378 RepID=UPI002169268E|nr:MULTISPECIES: SpaA isopeptide-forming pilin-related protein [unclassified Corynebacterium]MCS4490290.1 SpaA isopeptide-forming pilin-related protein [Corynebacterium sp. ES2775-CONJ]MCS4532004.1 SpaA isopeptide-forming pilin-related protein [Corynebacterium sp. ES2730-CONJ]
MFKFAETRSLITRALMVLAVILGLTSAQMAIPAWAQDDRATTSVAPDDIVTTPSAVPDDQPAPAEASDATAPIIENNDAPISVAAPDDKSLVRFDIRTKEGLVNSTDDRLDYWSGERIDPIVTLAVSGADVELNNAKVTITVPKTRSSDGSVVYNEKPDFARLESADSSEIGENDDAFYVEYTFKKLKSGQIFQFPLAFAFKNRLTPSGVEVTPQATFSSDELPSRTENITFTAQSISQYKSRILLDGGFTEKKPINDPQVGIYKFKSETKTDRAPKDKTFRYKVRINQVRPSGAPSGKGLYDGKTVTYQVTVPEGAKVDKTENYWVWDPVARTLTYSLPYARNKSISAYWSDGIPLTLRYDADIVNPDGSKKIFPIFLKSWVDKGTKEEVYAEETSVGTAFKEEVVPFQRGSVVKVDKVRMYALSDEYQVGLPQYTDWVTDGEALSYKYGSRPPRYYRPISLDDSQKGKTRDPKLLASLGGMKWRINVNQSNNGSGYDDRTGGIHDFLYEVTDRDLDPGLYYQKFQFNSKFLSNSSTFSKSEIYQRIRDSKVKLYGVRDDDSRIELAADLMPGDFVAINDTDREYKELKLVFDPPLELDNIGLPFNVWAYPTDAELAWWKQELAQTPAEQIAELSKSYSNRATADVRHERVDGVKFDETKFDGTGNNPILVKGHRPRLKTSISTTLDREFFSKDGWELREAYGAFNPTDTRTALSECAGLDKLTPANCDRVAALNVRVQAVGNWGVTKNTVRNLRQIVLLPPGVDYVNTLGIHAAGSGKVDKSPAEPQVIPNYKNTGLTALVYAFGDIDYEAPALGSSNANIDIYLTVDTTKNANFGPNTVQTYSVWDNADEIKAATPRDGGTPYVDTLDLDKDGNTDESFATAQRVIALAAPLEISSKVEVASPSENLVLETAHEIGSTFTYQMSLTNNTLIPAQTVSILALLPGEEDYTIVANEKGEYLDRTWESRDENGNKTTGDHSAFRTPLTGPVTTVEKIAPDGTKNPAIDMFDIYYTMTEQPQNPRQPIGGYPGGQDVAVWKMAEDIGPDEWAKVTAVKAVLKAGQVIASNERVYFNLPVTIPFSEATKALNYGDRAVMSVALSGAGNNYVEANQVYVEALKYIVSGKVFNDVNANGVQDDGEPGVANLRWVLKEANGEDALDPNGQRIEGSTNEQGEYSHDIFNRGDGRYIVFEKGDPAQYWTQDAQDVCLTAKEKTCSDVNLEGATAEFSLNPQSRTAVRNAGLAARRDVKIIKTDATSGALLEGVEFNLVHKSYPQVNGRTDANGVLIFKDVLVGTYALEEVEAPRGYKKPDNTEVIVGLDNTIDPIIKKVSNDRLPGTVTVRKVDNASPANPLKGARFKLAKKLEDGSYADPAQTAVTNDEGVATFDNVEWGEYQLLETRAPLGYRIPDPNIVHEAVEINSERLEYEVGDIVNNPITRTITATKVSDSGVPLEGVVFELYKNLDGAESNTSRENYEKQPSYTATSQADGKITFPDVLFGTYLLVEKEPLEGYEPLKEPLVVNVTEVGDPIDYGELTNNQIRGSASFTKVEAETEKVISGATFGIYKKDQDGIREDQPVDTQRSNERGEVSFNNLLYGDYLVKEITPAIGYLLPEEERNAWPVSITEQGEIVKLGVNGKIVNDLIRGGFRAKKVDAVDQNRVLSGAEFELRKIEDGVVIDDVIDKSTSDNDGNIEFAELPYGDYELRETKAPEGWLTSQEKYTFSIVEHGQVVDLGNIANEQITRSIKFMKVDSTNGAPLAGAEFGIHDAKGELIRTAVSNDAGEVIFEAIPYGEYTIKEIAPPAGWRASAQAITVTISEKGDPIELDPVQNDPTMVTARKIAADTKKPLEGAEFELRQGASVIAEATSDSQGLISFTAVKPGDYELVEVKAPSGFVLAKNSVPITIGTEAKNVDLGDIANDRVPSEPGTTPLIPFLPFIPGIPGKPNPPAEPGTPGKGIDKDTKKGIEKTHPGDKNGESKGGISALAQTGASVFWLLGVALVLLLLGASALLVARRRRN